MSLSSPEVTLFDAAGYNFSTQTTAVPEPSPAVLLLIGMAALPLFHKRVRT